MSPKSNGADRWVWDAEPEGWESRHFVGRYRAVLTQEVVAMAIEAGFERVLVHSPDETGYYQPIITAIRPIS